MKINNVKDILDKPMRENPEKIAFTYKENRETKNATFREFCTDVDCLGTAVDELFPKETHVAMLGPNSYKWLNVYLMALKSKNVFVPIDKELPFGDIINVLNNSDSEILFYSKKYEKDIKENLDKLSGIKYFIGLDRTEDEDNFLSFEKLKEKGKQSLNAGNRSYADNVNDPSKLKMIVYTSGTTGMSKGVMLSEHNIVSAVYYGLQKSTVYTKCLSVLPYHHTYEAVVGILVAIQMNVHVCINESLKAVLKNLQEYKPDYIYLVPAFTELFYKKIWAGIEAQNKTKLIKAAIFISNALRKIGIDLRSKFFAEILNQFGGNLREIVCGGAPIRAEVGKFMDDIGIMVINGYGITECSPLVSVNPIDFNDCRTVGMPLDCVEIEIRDKNEDGDGEICVKGDIVMMGYYKQPELTKEVLSDDGWFCTGDYGRITKHGQIVITGRKKNLIVLDNGKNIYPEEIEEYIQGISYVKEVIVYGVKNENGIEDRIAAEVFLDEEYEGARDKIKGDISAACASLPTYKKVSEIVIRDFEFEKTTTNKIKRSSVIGIK